MKVWREKASIEERRELYVCVLYHDSLLSSRNYMLIVARYLLKNISKSVLHEWWSREVPSRMTLFLDILAHCIECFEVCCEVNHV